MPLSLSLSKASQAAASNARSVLAAWVAGGGLAGRVLAGIKMLSSKRARGACWRE